MMKFFRKYNKQLLAVFMALLMIVFIGGSALEGLLTPGFNPLVGKSRFGEIYNADLQVAQANTRILEAMGRDWKRPAGVGKQPLTELDWVLLRQEAALYGAPPSRAAAAAVLGEDVLHDLARKLRIKPARVLEAVAEMRAIQQTGFAVAGATTPSEAAVQAATGDALETVKANFAVFPATAFVDENLQFTPEQLNAQFEKYRNTKPGGGLNFGYYKEPGLRVQFVEISHEAVAAQVKVAGLERRARQYYDERRTSDPMFRVPAELLPATLSTDGPPLDVHLSWPAAKSLAEGAVRKQLADQAVEDIAQRLVRFAADDLLEAVRGDDGYKTASDKVRELGYYNSLVAKVTEKEALKVWESQFFTQAESPEVAIIGSASYRSDSGAPRSFGELAFRTQAIVPKISKDEQNVPDYIAPFQTSSFVLKNRATGNGYVFRVIESRAGRPAESLSEVRDQVIRDLRLKAAYEQALARAESVRACETWPSIKDAFDHDDELAAIRERVGKAEMGFFEPAPFSRVSRFQAAQGRSPLGVFVGGGVGTLPNNVVDQIFALEDAHEKKAVLELPDRATVILVQWLETKRPTEEEFETTRKMIVGQMTQARGTKAMEAWFDLDQLRARNRFVQAGQ